jgi:hypothetical protein
MFTPRPGPHPVGLSSAGGRSLPSLAYFLVENSASLKTAPELSFCRHSTPSSFWKEAPLASDNARRPEGHAPKGPEHSRRHEVGLRLKPWNASPSFWPKPRFCLRQRNGVATFPLVSANSSHLVRSRSLELQRRDSCRQTRKPLRPRRSRFGPGGFSLPTCELAIRSFPTSCSPFTWACCFGGGLFLRDERLRALIPLRK